MIDQATFAALAAEVTGNRGKPMGRISQNTGRHLVCHAGRVYNVVYKKKVGVLEAHEVGALPGPAPFNPVLAAVPAGLLPAPVKITPVAPHPTRAEAALDRARGAHPPTPERCPWPNWRHPRLGCALVEGHPGECFWEAP